MSRAKKVEVKDGPNFEWPRKIFHTSIAIPATALYLLQSSFWQSQAILGFFLVILFIADVIRLSSRRFSKTFRGWAGALMRSEEEVEFNGTLYYIFGAMTVIGFFPRDLAYQSIMVLALCDSLASIVGRKFGRYTPAMPSPPFGSKKSVAGFLASASGGALLATGLWLTPLASWGVKTPLWPRDNVNPWFILAAALSAGLAEALIILSLDDNFTLPVLNAVFMSIALRWIR